MKKNHLQIGLAGMMLTATVLGTPAMAAQFADVASNHWASASISKMVDKGVLKGVGNNKFAPTKEVTYAEFVTMLVRQLQGEKQTMGEKWYSAYWDAAYNSGYLKGMETANPNAAINRYDMALMLLNAIPNMSIPMDGQKPADWNVVPEKYKDAILACYDNQLLQGLDKKGTFGGNTRMNRAQAATIFARLVGNPQTEKPPVVELQQHLTVVNSVKSFDVPITRGAKDAYGFFYEECVIDTKGYSYLNVSGTINTDTSLSFEAYNADTSKYIGSSHISKQQATGEIIIWGASKVILKVQRSEANSGVKISQITLEKVTPPSSNIPAGATQITDIPMYLNSHPLFMDSQRTYWNMTELGYGAFECNANGMGTSDSGMRLTPNGQYSKLTFTFQNTSKKMSQFAEVTLPLEYNGLRDVYVLNQTWVKPGETKTFTADITGKDVIQLDIGSGSTSNGILSNVYLTK